MLQSRSLSPPFINRWYLRWELTPALFWWHWAWIRFLLSVLGFYKESDLGYRIAWNCRTWYFSFKTNFTPFFHAYICSLSFSVLSIMNFWVRNEMFWWVSLIELVPFFFFFQGEIVTVFANERRKISCGNWYFCKLVEHNN